MSGPRSAYARDRVHGNWIALNGLVEFGAPVEESEDREPWPQGPGHCPNCSLEYGLAEHLTGRRSQSDHCSLCEDEEGL